MYDVSKDSNLNRWVQKACTLTTWPLTPRPITCFWFFSLQVVAPISSKFQDLVWKILLLLPMTQTCGCWHMRNGQKRIRKLRTKSTRKSDLCWQLYYKHTLRKLQEVYLLPPCSIHGMWVSRKTCCDGLANRKHKLRKQQTLSSLIIWCLRLL